jgi:hypothetical protein
MPCGQKPRHALWAFGTLVALLFIVAYWPGAPLSHGPSINALIHSSKGDAAATSRVMAPAAAAPAAAPPQQAKQPQPAQQQQPPAKAAPPAPAGGGSVLVELFVMSMCPDANYCEHAFNKILADIHPIVKVETQ